MRSILTAFCALSISIMSASVYAECDRIGVRYSDQQFHASSNVVYLGSYLYMHRYTVEDLPAYTNIASVYGRSKSLTDHTNLQFYTQYFCDIPGECGGSFCQPGTWQGKEYHDNDGDGGLGGDGYNRYWMASWGCYGHQYAFPATPENFPTNWTNGAFVSMKYKIGTSTVQELMFP